MTFSRKEIIGGCTLYLGDCLSVSFCDIVPFDVVVTDPPYGVHLGKVANGQARRKKQKAYTGFEDTPEYIKQICVPAFTQALRVSRQHRAALTPGQACLWLYPAPDDFGVWYNPAGTSWGKWGFILAQPILYYGKDPRSGKGQWASSVWGHNDSVVAIKNNLHPCPKPLSFTKWLVNKASLEGETVLDPFMGSGTTGVACVKTGRNFIGIEIDEGYFNVACHRIEEACRQPDLLIETGRAVTYSKQETFL